MLNLKMAGDHSIGIIAKERIEARVKLLYDYGYEQDQAPAWFLKPGDPKEGSSLGDHYLGHYWWAHNIIRYVIVIFFGI